MTPDDLQTFFLGAAVVASIGLGHELTVLVRGKKPEPGERRED